MGGALGVVIAIIGSARGSRTPCCGATQGERRLDAGAFAECPWSVKTASTLKRHWGEALSLSHQRQRRLGDLSSLRMTSSKN